VKVPSCGSEPDADLVITVPFFHERRLSGPNPGETEQETPLLPSLKAKPRTGFRRAVRRRLTQN
jgi:hypothetical protein